MTIIRKNGPKLSEADVASLERRIGAVLSADYRQFLLDFNGGRPTPDTADIPEHPESPTDVKVFYGIHREVESSCIEWNLTILSERLEQGLLPIAGDSGGNVFCLSLRPEDRGVVLYCDLQAVFCDYGAKPPFYPVAASFGEFLSSLREFEE